MLKHAVPVTNMMQRFKNRLHIIFNHTAAKFGEPKYILRQCAKNRKVASSIPDGVFGIFH
jgi:hypothetical protein